MPSHITHHDDCGCLSQKFNTAWLALSDIASWDHDKPCAASIGANEYSVKCVVCIAKEAIAKIGEMP